MKQKLINYLKLQDIKSNSDLWYKTRCYFKMQCIEWGGCYTPKGDNIIVRLESERFKIYLREL